MIDATSCLVVDPSCPLLDVYKQHFQRWLMLVPRMSRGVVAVRCFLSLGQPSELSGVFDQF